MYAGEMSAARLCGADCWATGMRQHQRCVAQANGGCFFAFGCLIAYGKVVFNETRRWLAYSVEALVTEDMQKLRGVHFA